MAACENKLGHHALAIAYVERYLAAASGLTEDDRAAASRFLAAARAYVGSVVVTSNIEGTQVIVDGTLVATTPQTKAVLLDEGVHQVRFVRDGYKAAERTERVLGGGAEMRWAVVLDKDGPDAAPSPPPERRPLRIGPILLGAAGVAAAGTGAVLVGISLGRASDVESECAPSCPPSRWEKFRTMQQVGDVLLLVGGAALAGGVVWWLVQPSGATEPAAWIAPSAGGVVAGGSL
jgi:hypothetical protein